MKYITNLIKKKKKQQQNDDNRLKTSLPQVKIEQQREWRQVARKEEKLSSKLKSVWHKMICQNYRS